MIPFLFVSSFNRRMILRDYVHDLNQEMNFDQIVEHFLQAYNRAAAKANNNQDKLLKLIKSVHTEEELREIIQINLKRLNIHFSYVATVAISGSSDDFEFMTVSELWDWWMDALNLDDKSNETDNNTGLNYDNEKDDELERIMNEMNQ